MRPAMFATLPLFAALIAAPATAQVSAHIRVDIPIGRPARARAVRVVAPIPRPVAVLGYGAAQIGPWQRTWLGWEPVTVYVVNGRFYDRPVPRARPMTVYRYRDRTFFPPRDRAWQRRPREVHGHRGR
jgi:hypothetical protein